GLTRLTRTPQTMHGQKGRKKPMMKRVTWTTLILGTGVLAATTIFSEQARSDDKSAAVYKQKCASCHGADGKGDTPAGKATKVRSFADPEVVKLTDDVLAAVLQKRKGKIPHS